MDEKELAYGASKAFLDKFAGTAAEKPAETLGSAWDYAFGWVNYAAARKQAIREKEHQDFLLTIGDNISSIPDENIQEPKLSLIGPALESTKYYIDEDELRELFINLISRSMDNRYNDDVNHAFVEIIKQLSPIDAYILKRINTLSLPVAKYNLPLSNGSIPLSDYYLIDDIFTEKQLSISLTNLKRLGLIEMPEGRSLTDESLYSQFLTNNVHEYYSSNNPISNLNKRVDLKLPMLNFDRQRTYIAMGIHGDDIKELSNYKGIDIDKSYVKLNNFGLSFYNICVK